MPPGWELSAYRTGDPRSSNGVYYKVCSTKTEDTCVATGPGLEKGRQGDMVVAEIHRPTGGPVIAAVIGIEYN